MRVLSRDTFMRYDSGRLPMVGTLTPLSADGQHLLMRIYWSIGDDTWDEHHDLLSHDNGQTWGPPRLVHRREALPGGGHMSYGEPAALYHPGQDQLVIITNYGFEPSAERASLDFAHRSHILAGRPDALYALPPLITDFGFAEGTYMSFCHPLVDARGRVLFPWQKPRVDRDGTLERRGFAARAGQPHVMQDYWEAGLLIGEFRADGQLDWRISQCVPFDVEDTSRGLCEPTVAELRDGRLAMLCRGSNRLKPEIAWGPRPGYKWLSYSSDGGETWSQAKPLACDDGTLLESSATGSYLFRSVANGKQHWIGNLCLDGAPANGNFPRTPLVIAELQEEPLALVRRTITVIDQRAPYESARVQLSNFRAYQDQATGDVVLFLNRFSEREHEGLPWHHTDLYRYRIAIA